MENHAGSDPGNLVSLCQVQALTVQAPHAVSHSAAWGRHLLLFASDVDSPSPLFKANDGAGFFTLAAYVPVHRAESALLFRVPGVLGTGIVVTQREEPEALFLRWNGTGVETCAKLPMSGSRTAAHIRGGDRDLLLLGGSREGLDGESQMYQTLVDILPEMDGPEALAVSPDGQHVYVLAPNSHAILCFKREQENGSLSFLANFTMDTTGPLQPGGRVAHGDRGYPLRSLAGLEFSPDGASLYTAGIFDNAIHHWQRDEASGELTYEGAFLSDGVILMEGPRSLQVTNDGKRVCVASTQSNAAVWLARDPRSGELSHVDTILNGERIVGSIALDTPLLGSGPGGLPAPIMATAAKRLVLDGREVLVVAASDDSPIGTGEVLVLGWNATAGTFETEQRLYGDSTVVDIDLFDIRSLDGALLP